VISINECFYSVGNFVVRKENESGEALYYLMFFKVQNNDKDELF